MKLEKSLSPESIFAQEKRLNKKAHVLLEIAKQQESEKINSKQFAYLTSADGKTKILKKL